MAIWVVLQKLLRSFLDFDSFRRTGNQLPAIGTDRSSFSICTLNIGDAISASLPRVVLNLLNCYCSSGGWIPHLVLTGVTFYYVQNIKLFINKLSLIVNLDGIDLIALFRWKLFYINNRNK